MCQIHNFGVKTWAEMFVSQGANSMICLQKLKVLLDNNLKQQACVPPNACLPKYFFSSFTDLKRSYLNTKVLRNECFVISPIK